MKKEVYLKSVIEVVYLELEYGLANSSVALRGTGVDSDYLDSEWETTKIIEEIEW